MANSGWIGVDLDATLAYYDHWRGVNHIGEPIPEMADRVRQWLSEGQDVRIFTARISDGGQRAVLAVQRWTFKHFGVRLPVTNVKDFAMMVLYDDRAVQVEKNTGRLVGG